MFLIVGTRLQHYQTHSTHTLHYQTSSSLLLPELHLVIPAPRTPLTARLATPQLYNTTPRSTMHTKAFLVGFTLCASVLTAPLTGLQRGVNVTQVEQREEAATDGEMHTTGLGIWKRATMNEASASRTQVRRYAPRFHDVPKLTVRLQAPAMQKRTGFGIISGGSNEEA
ncbi:hypothetical protein PG996_006791 [Apiospora saccharicola]|uniref:Uncharacterized protein n=1 Tax=Apiospora saccharicola TaxID=335842 RepID=A0ABR1V8Z8_9PEZI